MDILLYHFTGKNESFTKVKKVNQQYKGYEDWGIVYAYSINRRNGLQANFCDVEFAMLTKADRFTPAIQLALLTPQDSNKLNMELKMFHRDEKEAKGKLVDMGSMTLKKCAFVFSSLYYFFSSEDDIALHSMRIQSSDKPIQTMPALSMDDQTSSAWGASMLNSMWQKTIIRCQDFATSMKTSKGTVSVDTLRFLKQKFDA